MSQGRDVPSRGPAVWVAIITGMFVLAAAFVPIVGPPLLDAWRDRKAPSASPQEQLPAPVPMLTAVPVESVAAGLIAYFPFDGNADNATGFGPNGVPDGASLAADRHGIANKAYAFDGVNDSITIIDNPAWRPADKISVAVWIYATSQKTQSIIRKGNGPYRLALSETGDIVFELGKEGQIVTLRKSGYPLNEWIFIVGTDDGSSITLYINGIVEQSVPISGQLDDDTSPIIIGTRSHLPADTFQGRIDEVRIYDRALTADEVMVLFED